MWQEVKEAETPLHFVYISITSCFYYQVRGLSECEGTDVGPLVSILRATLDSVITRNPEARWGWRGGPPLPHLHANERPGKVHVKVRNTHRRLCFAKMESTGSVTLALRLHNSNHISSFLTVNIGANGVVSLMRRRRKWLFFSYDRILNDVYSESYSYTQLYSPDGRLGTIKTHYNIIDSRALVFLLCLYWYKTERGRYVRAPLLHTLRFL